MTNHLIIFPNTLFSKKVIKSVKWSRMTIWEHPTFFTMYPYHKAKLVFHRASMKDWARQYPKAKYVEYHEDFEIDDTMFAFDTFEHTLDDIGLELIDSPMFLLTRAELLDLNVTFRHHLFYKKMMTLFDLPFNKSYDKENRKPFPADYHEQIIKMYDVPEAREYVEEHFSDNLGTPLLWLPHTRKGALKLMKDFVKDKIAGFGPYEDAARADIVIGYHSGLAAVMNIGLITVQEILSYVCQSFDGVNNISSYEGFIRQLFWREYMAYVYLKKRIELTESNIFNHRRKLPITWRAPEMPVIDQIIDKIHTYAYAHHIERLMFLGNYLLYQQFSPKSVFNWYQSMFIDSYHVFMYGNVYGMSQHNAGTLVMTKPYICSTNYIKKMRKGKYTKEELEHWDELYRRFIKRNGGYLKKIYGVAHLVKKVK
jgi:deoxyribodipyrimidine photolyase-related protein